MKSTVMLATLGVIALLPALAPAQVSPIDATGWNHDMVINHPAPFNLSITGTMDGGLGQVENQAWVEEGEYPVWNGTEGVPTFVEGLVAGTHSSLTGNGTFAFQDFSGNNAVALDGGQSGVLTLTNPAAYRSIALYGAAGFGGKQVDILLTFADNSTALFQEDGEGIGTDWFNNAPDKALEVKGRASNKSEEGYTILFYQQNDAISINESFFTLAASDQSKLLNSVTITNNGGNRMVVFALSGEQIPEPTSLVLVGLCGIVALTRRSHVA